MIRLLKSLGFIAWKPWKSVQNVMLIHPAVVEMLLWSKLKWQADTAIPRAMLIAWLKKKMNRNVFPRAISEVTLDDQQTLVCEGFGRNSPFKYVDREACGLSKVTGTLFLEKVFFFCVSCFYKKKVEVKFLSTVTMTQFHSPLLHFWGRNHKDRYI